MPHISVTVIPEAEESRVRETNDMIEVYTTKPARAGEANLAVVSLIREHLSLDGPVRIVAGHKRPNKILEIPE